MRNKGTLVISYTVYDNDSRIQKKVKFFKNSSPNLIKLLVPCSNAYLTKNSEVIQINFYEGKLGAFGKLPFLKGILFHLKTILSVLAATPGISLIDVNDVKPLPLAVMAKIISFGRIKIIYDCHEYETETQFFNNKPIRKFLYKKLESFCLRFVNEVVCVTDSIADQYAKDYGIKKPHLVMNCAPFVPQVFSQNIFREKFNIPSHVKIFLYQGGLMNGRGLLETIDAFFELEKECALVIMGHGPLKDQILKKIEGSSNIFFHPSVAPAELLKFTSSADFGLCFAPNICLSYYYSLSNKIFEYIQARIPLLVSPLYEFKKIVESEDIGIVTKDYSVEEIIKSIETMLAANHSAFKENCDRVAFKYSWEGQEPSLKAAYLKYL